ncbi:neuromedin-U receptor 2-like [Patiria miniata]|uniref:G-protein coupled receptors family 1 profile domain-containing protein n=1 Tax=Patiria miniata TaxID=46514 RepID=A0A914AB87_PATMI|nr:neuromedin-U receptor 2-like [Patiria miniata]
MVEGTSFPNGIDGNGCIPDQFNDTLLDDLDRPTFLRLASFSVSALGCLANVSLLLVLIRHKSMHTAVNIYLANLAVADVVLLALGSFGVLTDVLEYLPRDFLGCVYIVLTAVPFITSLLTVSLLTLERYYAVCQPLKHRTVSSSTKRSIRRVGFVWCCSLLYSSLTHLENGLSGNGCRAALQSAQKDSCDQTDEPHPLFYSDICRPLLAILLLFINCLLYFRIIRRLKKSLLFRNTFASSMPVWFKNIRQSRIRMTRMLAVNTFIFFTCNTPRIVLVVINFACAVVEWPPFANETATVTSNSLLLLNSCVNPLIYVLTNEKYRRAFREVFLPACCKPSPAGKSRKAVIHLQALDGSNPQSATTKSIACK